MTYDVFRISAERGKKSGPGPIPRRLHHRQRLRDAGAVDKAAYGYRLRDGIQVDLVEFDLFVRSLQGDDALDELTALRFAALAKQLDVSRPAFIAGWEWFGSIEGRIEEWRRFARYRLACDALARDQFETAVKLAQAIITRDELYEPAWELTIHALVEKGNRAAAQRELRRYRDITLRELNAEPPSELYDLVESAHLEEAEIADCRRLRPLSGSSRLSIDVSGFLLALELELYPLTTTV